MLSVFNVFYLFMKIFHIAVSLSIFFLSSSLIYLPSIEYLILFLFLLTKIFFSFYGFFFLPKFFILSFISLNILCLTILKFMCHNSIVLNIYGFSSIVYFSLFFPVTFSCTLSYMVIFHLVLYVMPIKF